MNQQLKRERFHKIPKAQSIFTSLNVKITQWTRLNKYEGKSRILITVEMIECLPISSNSYFVITDTYARNTSIYLGCYFLQKVVEFTVSLLEEIYSLALTSVFITDKVKNYDRFFFCFLNSWECLYYKNKYSWQNDFNQ